MHTSLDSIGKVSLMMDLISQRQRAIGSNIANVDTPGYVRKDIDFATYFCGICKKLFPNLWEFLLYPL